MKILGPELTTIMSSMAKSPFPLPSPVSGQKAAASSLQQ